MKAKSENIRAVDRALEVLLAFRLGDRALPVSTLLRRVNLSRPTLYRLIATLQERGFLVAIEGHPMKLSLGPSVGQLANAWRSSLSITQLAQPMLKTLWEHSQETVSLFLREDISRVCVLELESPHPLSYRRGVGYRQLLVRGASGRVILAFSRAEDESFRSAYENSSIAPESQAEELLAIRKRGYAISRHELIEGAVAMAAPVLDNSGNAIAAIAIFGPSVRLRPTQVREYIKPLCEQAARLSFALGHTPSAKSGTKPHAQ
ncbi:IclR family transcriptional regulator [Pusillimonas noertemannii]|uniref:IclR family transcriptional regulator n=1 Tax=Pusillimonas noertemannii TaxID=305977 RepID=A0A2U1CL32_9BURK|nr:IclR family transcriptional regulator [Pusillimonas noertemannii]NYT69233.1 IclR family transcriptional regulator [Pusillimonas noertemannii]PVY61702.1 IclR family transcriptional regulator [Pusillimonas noertemannii]TFL09642.1 IclR family transcriptional regulator [Pusillimonas noertemannii]